MAKGLSDAEIEEICKVNARAGEILKIINGNPENRLFISISRLMSRYCDEIDERVEKKNSILTSEKDEKFFDRIQSLIKEFGKYNEALKSGRNLLQQQEILEGGEKGGNFFFEKGNGKKEQSQS